VSVSEGEHAMAYDRELADRIRALVAKEDALTEMAMFGGLAFLIGGSMAVAAGGHGNLMVRVDPVDGKGWIAQSAAEPMEMDGRTMTGWLSVPLDQVATDHALETWVSRGVSYARSLPPKAPRTAKGTSSAS
jgi:hypothetical protein